MAERLTRRELFARFKPSSDERELTQTPKMDFDLEKGEISRRQFLNITGLAVMGAVATRYLREDSDSAELQENDGCFAKEISENSEEVDRDKGTNIFNNYFGTLYQSILVSGFAAVVPGLGKRAGLPVGSANTPTERHLKNLKNPLYSYGLGAFFAPLYEEAFFRLTPSKLLDLSGAEGIQWDVGVPLAIIFGYLHQIDPKKNRIQKDFPLSPVIGGLFTWYLMRERGFWHAYLGHATNNFIAASYATALINLSPESYKEALEAARVSDAS